MRIKFLLPLGVLIFGVIISLATFAQVPPPEPTDEEIVALGITFPIPELGNCASKDACRTYCNEPSHMQACIKFGEDHSLITGEEARQARRFSALLPQGGPGGCTSPESCHAFCSRVENLETCIAFAEEHDFQNKNYEQGKKIHDYLRAGGKMPGGCTGEASCRAYCSDFSHAEECYEFAKRAGIAQGRPERFEGEREFERGIPTPDQLKKLKELAEKGETPGGCTSKEKCEAYCSVQGHFEECITFGVKAGFISPEEAERVRKIGGQGPGGCNSPESCHAYCNEPTHQEECFRFAEEHGFIREEEVERIKESWVKARQGFENAPPEVHECLKSVLGQNIIEDIEAGKFVPGPAIGERVQHCFEQFGASVRPQEVFRDAPPGAIACLKEKFGDDFEKLRSGRAEFTPEKGDAVRVCFEKLRFEEGGAPGAPPPRAMEFLRSAPPGVASCLERKLGDDFLKLKSGELLPSGEIRETIRSCFEEFRPVPPPAPAPGGTPPPGAGLPPTGFSRFLEEAPPAVRECLKETVGEEVLSKIRSGAPPPTDLGEKMRLCFERFGGGVVIPPPGEVPGPLPLPAPTGECRPTGCSGELCADRDVVTTCEFRAEYGCYKAARCERQATGQCGWTFTDEAKACLQNIQSSQYSPPSPPPAEGCYDYASCSQICSDSSNPYYSSEGCARFRSSQTQPQSRGPFARLLGTILSPFLRFLPR